MNKKYLVTGGAGFIGSNFIFQQLRDKDNICKGENLSNINDMLQHL
jgi:dTDP-D-glucose 4,6-dehydratase